MVRIVIAFFLILIVTACVVEIEPDLEKSNSIVLNGLIVPGDTITVSLHRSGVSSDTTDFTVIENAELTLFVKDEKTEILPYLGNGKYSSSLVAKELTHYKIQVETDLGEEAWAETTTPMILANVKVQSNWEIDSTYRYNWPYHITILDNPDYENNYWVCNLSTEIGYDSICKRELAYVLRTSSLLADKFNTTYDPENIDYPYDYNYFIHFSDIKFQGDKLEFDFLTPRSYTKQDSILVFNMDEHYSNYLKSKMINEEGADYISDDGPPLNYKPTFLYSNVHGGMGILGSYTVYSKTYQYD